MQSSSFNTPLLPTAGATAAFPGQNKTKKKMSYRKMMRKAGVASGGKQQNDKERSEVQPQPQPQSQPQPYDPKRGIGGGAFSKLNRI